MSGAAFVRVALLCTGLVGAASCVRVIEPELKPLRSPSKEPIRLRAGLFRSPDLRARANVALQWQGVIVSLQGPLVSGVERTVRSAFQDVVEVSSPELAFDREGVSVVVVPEIRRLEFESVGWFGAISMLVSMDWRIVDRTGGVIWRDTVSSEGAEECNSKFPAGAMCGRALAEDVIQRVFQQSLEHLLSGDWWNYLDRRRAGKEAATPRPVGHPRA